LASSQQCNPDPSMFKSDFDMEADSLSTMVWDMDVNDSQQIVLAGELTDSARTTSSAFL